MYSFIPQGGTEDIKVNKTDKISVLMEFFFLVIGKNSKTNKSIKTRNMKKSLVSERDEGY